MATPNKDFSQGSQKQDPARKLDTQTESWITEDIDDNIESPRTTPRHESVSQEATSKPPTRNANNPDWNEAYTDAAEFEELDEDMYLAQDKDTENDEDWVDEEEEENVRDNNRRDQSLY